MEKKIVQPMASRAFINEGDDIILSINAEAKARIKQGEDIINASIGTLFDEDGHFSSIPIINQALQANLDVDGRSYPTVGGGPKFEQGILDWLLYGESEAIRKEFKTRVVATTGGTGAVTLALRNYTELHQTVLIPSPGWANYKAIISQVEGNYLFYSLFDEHLRFNLTEVRRLAEEVVKREGRLFLIINDPGHNPTGYTMSEEEMDGLIDLLNELSKQAPTVLCFDIAYFDFTSASRSRLMFRKLHRMNDTILPLFCFSASKTFSIYGLRLGALVAFSRSEQVIQNFTLASLSVARAIWSCSNAHAIETVSSLLSTKQQQTILWEQLALEREMLAKRGALFMEEAQQNKLSVFPYKSGFFITLLAPDANKIAEDLKKVGIFVLPMKNQYLRVALSCITLAQTHGLAAKIKQYL